MKPMSLVDEPVIDSRAMHEPKILLVDDKRENLIALERLLKDLPVQLFMATNGNDALKLTLHHKFALALLDIQMPEMDGYELAEFLRQEESTAGLPFIFISAIYTDSIDIFEGYEKGAFSYITKPFEPEELLSKVRFFIEKYQQEQQLRIRTKELEKINQELESFTYSVSHDLRAPLRAITGYSNILMEDHYNQLEEDGKSFLRIISEEATRMGNLIDNLLSFSRLSRQEKKQTRIDMTAMVTTVWDKLTEMNHDVDPELKCSNLHKVDGDCDLLQQVWINLLGNAIKYRKANHSPKIVVDSCRDDDTGKIIFSVTDNGVGFNTKYADKLFGVFQRLHSEDEFEGTGIGLALVRRIINRHGGEVWADSKVDKGSTFYFSLPLNEEC